MPFTLPGLLAVHVVEPAGQLSTASTVVVTGSELDATAYETLAYTIVVATQNVNWSVFAANAANYSDEVAVLTATQVNAGASSSYAVSPAPFRFYRVKIIDTGGGLHGTATIRGIVKA